MNNGNETRILTEGCSYMNEFIYSENGKYYRELTDLIGNSLYKEEIAKEEYLSYKNVR